MRCIGFGPHEGKCDRKAGSKHSQLWCPRCDKLRMDHLDGQFTALAASFGNKEPSGSVENVGQAEREKEK